MRYMVFDVESIGLHGEGFAVGWVLIDGNGVEYAGDEYGCPAEMAKGKSDDLKWVTEHCHTLVNCARPRDVRDEFWSAYRSYCHDHPKIQTLLAADVTWPVEAHFLRQVFLDDEKRRTMAPYPLIDIASVRFAAGLNPLATCRRFKEELPPHSPLADARQSARLLLEALHIVNRGVVVG